MAALMDTEALPIEPGAGPFRIKGVAYIGHLDYVRRFAAGGIEAMHENFKDKRQSEFFKQKFLHASFYDIFPLVASGHVCARQCRLTFTQFLRMRSRFQAEQDIQGVHSLLLKLVSPGMVVTRLPSLQSQYLDFHGGGEAQMVEPKHALLQRRQLPEILARWFAIVNETYIEVALKAAGADGIIVRPKTLEHDAVSHGYPTVRYQCDVFWE